MNEKKNEKFVVYFNSLGVDYNYFERIRELYQIAKNISPAEIEDMFVSEYLDDGVRKLQSVWFFTSDHAIEAHFTSNQVDIMTIKEEIKKITILTKDYGSVRPSDQSRLTVRFRTDFHVEAEMKASKENCGALWHILLTYLKPNLIRDR